MKRKFKSKPRKKKVPTPFFVLLLFLCTFILFISSHRIWTFFPFDLAAATCQGSIVRMLRTWFYCSRDTCHPPRIGFGRFFVLLFSPPTRAKVVYCSRRDPTLISQPIRAVPKGFALGRLARFHSSKVCVFDDAPPPYASILELTRYLRLCSYVSVFYYSQLYLNIVDLKLDINLVHNWL